MLKKVAISQEVAAWLILEHQYLVAILQGDVNAAQTFQNKLAKMTTAEVHGYWVELFDEYQKVKNKDESGKIQRHIGVMK